MLLDPATGATVLAGPELVRMLGGEHFSKHAFTTRPVHNWRHFLCEVTLQPPDRKCVAGDAS